MAKEGCPDLQHGAAGRFWTHSRAGFVATDTFLPGSGLVPSQGKRDTRRPACCSEPRVSPGAGTQAACLAQHCVFKT